MRADHVGPERRDDRIPRHDEGRDAPVVVRVVRIAARADQESALGILNFELRPRIGFEVHVAVRAFVHRIVIEVEAMQRRDVARVDAAFERL